MNRYHVFGILIATVCFGILLANLLFSEWYVLEVYEGDIIFRVTDGFDMGFAADKDKIHFGTIPLGGRATRETILQSGVPATVYVYVIEDTGWVSAKNVTVDLEPGDHVRVPIVLSVPWEATPGNYSGRLRVTYVRRLWG